MTELTVTHKPKRARSPSYPGIDLREALSRARVLYNAERRNAAPVDAILGHWGYRPRSGAGLVILAALKKFGLVTDGGTGKKREARLSELALRILLDEREDSAERRQLLQEAALTPTIHQELWEEYGGSLPSDATLRHKLLFEKSFTERAVRELIPVLRETIAFANLTDGATLSFDEEDKQERDNGGGSVTPPSPSAGAHAIQLPIATGRWATLQASFPLTDAEWNQMLAVLNAMKPGLVTGDGEAPREGDKPDDPDE